MSNSELSHIKCVSLLTSFYFQMWSIDYVQVPKEEVIVAPLSPAEAHKESGPKLRSRNSEERKTRVKKELAKQMSISAELSVDQEQGILFYLTYCSNYL